MVPVPGTVVYTVTPPRNADESPCPCFCLGLFRLYVTGRNEREDEHQSPGRAAQVRSARSTQQVPHVRGYNMRGRPRFRVLVPTPGGKLSDSPTGRVVDSIQPSAHRECRSEGKSLTRGEVCETTKRRKYVVFDLPELVCMPVNKLLYGWCSLGLERNTAQQPDAVCI